MQVLWRKVLALFIFDFFYVLWILLIFLYPTGGFISVTKSHSSIDYFWFYDIIILYEYVPTGTWFVEK